MAAAEAGVQIVKKNVSPLETYDVTETVMLKSPRDIQAGADGDFFVTDGGGYVHHVSKSLGLIRLIGKQPPGFQGEWGYADGIFFDPKKNLLYICYPPVNAIRIYLVDSGELVKTLSLQKPDPSVSTTQAFVPTPVDVAVGVDGKIWIVDGQYFQLVALDGEGKELKRYGLNRGHPDRLKPGLRRNHQPVTSRSPVGCSKSNRPKRRTATSFFSSAIRSSALPQNERSPSAA